MKYRRVIFVILLNAFVLFYFSTCKNPLPLELDYSRPYMEWSILQMGLPKFNFDVLHFIKDSIHRADIYLQVSYDRLPFIRDENGYKAEYIYRIIIFDEDKEIVKFDREFEKKITSPDWKDEYRQLYDFNLVSINLVPDIYYIWIMVKEKNSNHLNYKIKKFQIIPEKNSTVCSSSLMLLKGISRDNSGLRLHPLVSEGIPYLDQDSIFSFCEIYAHPGVDKVKISYSIERVIYPNESSLGYPYISYTSTSYQRYEYMENYAEYKVFYKNDSVVSLRNPKLFLSYPIKNKVGNFIIRLKIEDPSTGNKFDQLAYFKILPLGFPNIISLNDRIDVLRYILKPNENKYFDTVRSETEKRTYLQKIMSEMDPVVLEDYFKRAEYANERFTSVIEGWRTPPGMIYIVCGEPYGTYQNIWYYYGSTYTIEISFAEVQQRDKYMIYPRLCYLMNFPQNFVTFWWDRVDKIRGR